MKIKRRHREGTEVSTDSLNDIMFFLLIFFLIISTLVNPGKIKINLPSSTDKSPTAEKKPVVLAVTKDFQYYFDNKQVDVVNLESAITSWMSQVPDPTILLQVDKELSVQDLVNVMQIGAKLKVKMVLGTKPPNAG